MKTVILQDYGLTLTDFLWWVEERNAKISRVIYNDEHATDRPDMFTFYSDEDLTAFKLSFSKRTQSMDLGFFYCPYIPLYVTTIISKDINEKDQH